MCHVLPVNAELLEAMAHHRGWNNAFPLLEPFCFPQLT
jgi:hypothetical protein